MFIDWVISVKTFLFRKVKRRNLMKRIRWPAVAVRQLIARCRCQPIRRLTMHRNAKVRHLFCFSEKPHQSVASVQSCDQIGHLFFLHFICFVCVVFDFPICFFRSRWRAALVSYFSSDNLRAIFNFTPSAVCRMSEASDGTGRNLGGTEMTDWIVNN